MNSSSADILDDEPGTELQLEIPDSFEGLRLDQALATLLPRYSRSTIQGWIKSGLVLRDERSVKASEKLRAGLVLRVAIPVQQPAEWLAQDIPLDIVYRDDHLFVINKPAGLVVHPGAGNPDGTLLNALLALDEGLRLLPRAGIVHRLDKDTSGLMVVARTEKARLEIVSQLSARTVSRRYLAIVVGVPVSGETIDQPIARHPVDRVRMAVSSRGKPAITHFRVMEKFRRHSLLEARLETGRTHQIRVHLAWRGFPLVGDPVYGGRPKPPAGADQSLVSRLQDFRRQALHATALSLTHPESQETVSWQRPAPADFLALLEALQADRAADHSI